MSWEWKLRPQAEKCSCIIGISTIHGGQAGVEPTGMYLRRVTELSTEFMSITDLAHYKAIAVIQFSGFVKDNVGQRWPNDHHSEEIGNGRENGTGGGQDRERLVPD